MKKLFSLLNDGNSWWLFQIHLARIIVASSQVGRHHGLVTEVVRDSIGVGDLVTSDLSRPSAAPAFSITFTPGPSFPLIAVLGRRGLGHRARGQAVLKLDARIGFLRQDLVQIRITLAVFRFGWNGFVLTTTYSCSVVGPRARICSGANMDNRLLAFLANLFNLFTFLCFFS